MKRKHFSFEEDALTTQFKERIAALLERAKRLAKMEAEGWRYRRVRVEKTHVKAHTRKAHWVMRPVKRK